MKMFSIVAAPSRMDYAALVEAMLGAKFAVRYDTSRSETSMFMEESVAERLRFAVPGLGLSVAEPDHASDGAECMVVYPPDRETRNLQAAYDSAWSPELFSDIYEVMSGVGSCIWVICVPSEPRYVKRFKSRIEESLGGIEVRRTRSEGGRSQSSSLTNSMQTEVYSDSEERKVFLSMLSMLDSSAISNWNAYKAFVVTDGRPEAAKYIKSKVLVIEERSVRVHADSLFSMADQMGCVPLSTAKLAELLFLRGTAYSETTVRTSYPPKASGGIELGNFLRDSVTPTQNSVSLAPRTLNMGSVLSGLPGSGKTFAAMSIISQAICIAGGRTVPVIISPTAEWSEFGRREGIRVIRIYDSACMNLFGCYTNVNIEKFYENLAVLISSSSGAGPYRGSMEKCLLSAFHNAYSNGRQPDPVSVYHSIEDAVISQHGKRTNAGVKYTKHGENVMAALENLRLMLSRPEFAYAEGENMKDVLLGGVVFDLSLVSNGMKPFFYSMILNQVYSVLDEMDEKGTESLRMLVCLEEAQTVFGQDDNNGATIDLRQRMQDFRKKGLGMMLLTHNISDISQGIRRICQTKLYFRQSPDLARYAATDLGFDEESYQDAVARLRQLEHRTCACTYFTEVNGARRIANPVFIRTGGYELDSFAKPVQTQKVQSKGLIDCTLTILGKNGKPEEGAGASVKYLGENAGSGVTDSDGRMTLHALLPGKAYEISVRISGHEIKAKAVKLSFTAAPEVTLSV